jgi:hypothetical protein
VTRLEENVIDWLKYGGSCIQELIVTDHYCIDDIGLDEFSNIPLQLSMLWTREKHPSMTCHRRTYIDYYSDTDSMTSDVLDTDSMTSGVLHSELSDSTLSCSDPSPSSLLDLPAPMLDRIVMTVLDRLPDGGSHLTRLALALDFEKQWVSTIASNTPTIPPKLTA